MLEKKYRKKESDEKKASGISPSETELDQLMEEILAKVREYEEINLKNDEDKKEKMDKEENIAKDVRKKCMETYSESLKRKKLLGEDESPRRKRSTGSETILYLKEKSEKEMKLREEDLELKRNEQSQFTAFMQQQQTVMQQAQKQAQEQTAMMMQTQQALIKMMEKFADK